MAIDSKKEALQKKLDDIKIKENQIKKRIRILEAKQNEDIRKKETRAKIILGGFIISHVKKNDEIFIELFNKAIFQSSERDKKTLIDYKKKLLNDE